MRTEELVITADGQRLAATKVYPSTGLAPSVLTLHGLGATANRHTIRYVLDDLAVHGYGSMCFDFSGNGDSTGVLSGSSLRRRRAELMAAAGELSDAQAPVLIGTSMGAHLAAWSVPVLRPRGLVLFCPAAYPASATDLVFDANFARPGNHPDSPAFAGIGELDGDLLIVAARNDHVVPADVVDGYLAHARKARSTTVIWIDDCDHFIHRALPHRPAARSQVLDAIRRVVTADRAPVAT